MFLQFSFCYIVTKKARESVEHTLDIPYANSEKTKYDVYGTNLPKGASRLHYIVYYQ